MHGFATVIPLYLCLHLAKSGTVFAPTTALLKPGDYESLQAVPLVVLFAYFFFTIFICLPTPALISHRVKVKSTALWLIFPIFGHFLGVGIRKHLQKAKRKSNYIKKDDIALLRRVYAFGLVIAAVGHIYTMLVSFSALLFPGVFNENIVQSLVPGKVLVPTSPFRSDFKVSSIAEGVHVFMQWDYLISGLAYVVWGTVIRHSVYAQDDSQVYKAFTRVGWTGLLELVLRNIFLGPIASALSLVWERDEIVFAHGQAKAN